ncbi:globin [Enteractinococcus fodinae]|uniref:globin n=1 Tax=Enteractinococcus fodinae TaxID=684663 RepID=UPI00286A9BAB|nr:globin [Enteractinococcus fodinae]
MAALRAERAAEQQRRDGVVSQTAQAEQPAQEAAEPTEAAKTAQQTNAPAEQTSFYEQVGGEPTFRKLAAEFYKQVDADPEFKAMYPEEDLGPAEDRLRMFLIQYWGGPTDYSQQRGHPRLRARHMPYHIDSQARDTWLKFMRNAMDTLELSPLHDETMWDYFQRAARAMQNQV